MSDVPRGSAVEFAAFAIKLAPKRLRLILEPQDGKAALLTNRLRELREARGLTLRALADLVSTSNQQLNKLELGHRQLSTDWLRRLAAALKCHPWEIVEGVCPTDALTDGEQQLLLIFRHLSGEQQQLLLAEMTARAGPSNVSKRRAG